jgi:hypothetical protein
MMAARWLPKQPGVATWVVWLDEIRRQRRNYSETLVSRVYSQQVLDHPLKFGVCPPVVKGVVRNGTIDPSAFKQLSGIERDGPFTQWRFDGVRGTIKRLFEASTKVCLELESRAVSDSPSQSADAANSEQEDRPEAVPNDIGAAAIREALQIPAEARVGKFSDPTYTAGARLVSAVRAFNEPVLGALLPRMEYPKHLYHKTLKPVIALNKSDENKARAEGYGDEYPHQDFPKYKFSLAQDGSMIERVVKTPEEEKTLGQEWVDHPDRLTPMPTKRPALSGTRTLDK